MTTMFRIHEGVVPDYLREIFPNKLERISKCNPRTKSQYSIPRCELMVLIRFFCTTSCLKMGLDRSKGDLLNFHDIVFKTLFTTVSEP